MCETYSRWLLRVSVAQICQALGWDSVQVSACDLLTDVLQRYLQGLGRGCHRYCELYGRTDPILDDVGDAFKLMGVNLHELEDYIHNIEPVTFAHQIPSFPVSKNNVLQFPQLGSKDAEERKEYIPDYLPPIVSSQEELVIVQAMQRLPSSSRDVLVIIARESIGAESLSSLRGAISFIVLRILPFPLFAADVILGPVTYESLMLPATWKCGNAVVKLQLISAHL
ncbi:hypothetical protein DUI87_13288 [Hirundo rustica rustica]|uniref:Bromodomain associated domain-containing protein n=1 Tax=Hirundo rustica rustica TaxID=333673 RepID=A0A3M0KBA4_HIRRU|nr:hypothetical protein DUI87_13288 [Hirundo rustica rustica]